MTDTGDTVARPGAVNEEPTMKAMIHDQYGPPDILRLDDVASPIPGDREVLVRVHAAGVNWADYSILTGVP